MKTTSRYFATIVSVTALVLALGLGAIAQQSTSVVPSLVNFSGTLVDANGKPLTGTLGVTFYFYRDPQGGSPLWVETQNIQPDRNGHYTVTLGATTSQGLPSDLFVSGEARWLGVQAQGQPEQPRVMLLAVPYALKAGDAQTVGGLPASAFVLAAPGGNPTSSSSPSGNQSSASGPNVGGTGKQNYISIWTDNSGDLGDSVLYQLGSGGTAQVGVGTTTPAATLDVNGAMISRGAMQLPSTGTATATQGYKSQPLDLQGSAFNSGTSKAISPTFQWQTEPFGNNTSNPAGTLNLLYGNGSGTPSETGLNIASNGMITFASGQTFPGAGTITGVTAGTGLSGGGTKGNVTLSINTSFANQYYAQLGAANTFTKNQTVNGTMTATSFVGNGASLTNVNATELGGLAAGAFAQLAQPNTFTQTQTVNSTNPLTEAINATSPNYGVIGTMNSASGSAGVLGQSTATGNGFTYGVIGTSSTSAGYGVSGTGNTAGVYGSSLSASGNGVSGVANGASGNGVYGSGSNAGIYGTSGSGSGVYGTSAATNGIGVYGDGGTSGYGVFGGSNLIGVYGNSNSSGWGVYGGTYSGPAGVGGTWSGPSGLFGPGAAGVWGDSNGYAAGVLGTSDNFPGVYGESAFADGVDGITEDCSGCSGVTGIATNLGYGGYGVYGENDNAGGGQGVWGIAYGNGFYNGAGADGVHGVSTNNSGSGVAGVNTGSGGTGVYGSTPDTSGYAGYFDGNIYAYNFLASATQMRIDHPSDPTNRYLYHASVESAEMLTMYSGNVMLDANGEAQVQLPSWFETLNRDFRYQLTSIGGFAPVYIAQEIQNHKFTIAGGKPGSKISWTVTAVRQDAYAKAHPMAVESAKSAAERGTYLHPELYGASAQAGLSWARYRYPQPAPKPHNVYRPAAKKKSIPQAPKKPASVVQSIARAVSKPRS